MRQSGFDLRGPLLALLAFAVFSGHDVVVKYLGGGYSAFQIVFFSVLLGLPLAMLMLMRDQTDGTLLPRHPWWTALRTAAAVATGVCVFFAFSVLPMTQVYAILFAAPLLITVLSIPILGEKVGIRRGAAVLVGLCGVLIVLRPGSGDGLNIGHAAALVGAVGSALSSIIVRKIGQDERNVVLLLYPMMANLVVMACALPFIYEPMPLLDFAGFAAIAGLAFVASLCLIAAYKMSEAAIIAPMQYSQIIWAAIFGYLFFSETPDLGTIIGASVIIGSGLYILGREGRANVSENRPVSQTKGRAETGTMPRMSAISQIEEDRVQGDEGDDETGNAPGDDPRN